MTPQADEDIVEQVFREHYAEMLNYAFRMTGDREEAEDVASHVFLVFAEAVRRGTTPPAQRPWLYRCAHNRVVSLARRRLVRQGNVVALWRWLTGNAPSGHPVVVGETRTEADRVRAALLTLSPDDRQVIVLRYDEEMDFAAIGSILGLAESSVRSRLTRAMARLRTALGETAHE